MGVTQALSDEHRAVLRRLAAFEEALEPFDEAGIRETLRFFDEQLVLHRRKEEEVLFPRIGAVIGTETGPIACMLHEHADEREKIEAIRTALEGDVDEAARRAVVEAGRYIVVLLRNHIFKEDVVLFPLSEQVLDAEAAEEVLEGFDRIGYCADVSVER